MHLKALVLQHLELDEVAKKRTSQACTLTTTANISLGQAHLSQLCNRPLLPSHHVLARFEDPDDVKLDDVV